jgi:tetratricopeptide (TPR) repeat protein
MALLLSALAACAQDLESAYKNLKEAEGNKDLALVKKWAGETSRIARGITSSTEPADAAEKENWKARVDYAKQVDTYTEYSMYALALQLAGSAQVIDLCDTLEAQNAKSQYLSRLAGKCMVALSQSGAQAKVVPFAERLVSHDPSNEDALMVLADTYQNARQSDKAVATARKLVEVLKAKPKPAGIDDASWQKKKATMLGRGYWIAGVIHGEKSQYFEADKALRAALPLITSNAAMRAAALFYLGVANYQLGKTTLNKPLMAEAAKFSEECAALPGPYRDMAQKNVQAIRAELAPTPRRK